MLQGINISGAEGLSIMNMPKGSTKTKALTKADGETLTRLCIVTKGGNKIAEFNMKIEGATNNPVWEKIYPTLSYAPQMIVDISSNFILLVNVDPIYDQSLLTPEEHSSVGEKLNASLATAAGCYLLRKSDGTLYRSPLISFPYDGENYGRHIYNFNETSDKKSIVYGGWVTIEQSPSITFSFQGLMLIKDAGSKLESINTNGQVLDGYEFSYLLDDNRCVVFQGTDKTGVWTFDMNLTPTFMDFGDNLRSNIPHFFIPNGNKPYAIVDGSIGKIVSKDGKLDYEKIAQLNCAIDVPYTCTKVGNTLELQSYGTIIKIDTITDNVSETQYPEGFPTNVMEYSNGVCYKLSDDFKTITSYNLNTLQITTVNVNWAGNDELISGTNYGGAGFFTVTGLSRSAATLSYLINKETGEVTLLKEQTYTAPAVTCYLPLN